MPNFYAKQILENGDVHCIGKEVDEVLEPLLSPYGVCKSIKEYNLKNDTDGNPLISEC